MTLQEYRKKHNETYQGLAKKLGMSEATVYRICNGNKCIKLSDAKKIIANTGGDVTISDLLQPYGGR
jgi:DNA-binding XRE family transcriptional regulator